MFENIKKENMDIVCQIPVRILIVDDDPDMLDALKDVLVMDEKYIVETATNIFSAKQKLNEFSPDIALIDIRLGNGNGLDLIPIIKNESVYADCIMMTAYREIDYAIKALRYGAVDYLLKPIEPDYLLKTIDTFLHQRRIRQEKLNKDENLKKMALQDPLTGLANRALLSAHIDKTLARNKRNKQQFSVMYIDLDNFKLVNDSLGHQAGDELLVNVSRNLKKCIRDEDIIARIGGDEFVVVLSSETDSNATHHTVERLMNCIRAEHRGMISASIGIAVFPYNGITADDLLRNADNAMYLAKKKGKNCFQYCRN